LFNVNAWVETRRAEPTAEKLSGVTYTQGKANRSERTSVSSEYPGSG